MDETRKLLDSLMGGSRDQSFEDAKKTQGKNFMKDSICKSFLLGFCPLSDLSESKMAGKRHIKQCEKTHSEAMKSEFAGHADKAKYQAEYERAMLPVLEGLAREADSWASRERSNLKPVGKVENVTTNSMAPEQKEQYDQMKADMDKMMSSAEDEAEKGNIDGSKFKVMLADEIKEKVQELEEKHFSTFEVTHKGEDVCEVCGTRYEALNEKNHARHKAHFEGKVHLGYVKIRDWISKLKKDGGDKPKRDDNRGRERRRSRSQKQGDGSCEKDREPERERRRSRSRKDRERRRSRSRRDRPPERRGDRRSRSRGDRRGYGRD